MKNGILYSSWIFLITLLIAIHHSYCVREFPCASKGGLPFPTLPSAYSTNIRINFETSESTTEVKYAVNSKEKKEFLELRSKDRLVNYIIRKDQNCVLLVTYRKDAHPTCVVKKTLDLTKFLETEDNGPNNIFAKAFIVILRQTSGFYDDGVALVNGVYVKRWEGCFVNPPVNVSVSFAGPQWSPAYTSPKIDKDIIYPEQAEAQITGSKSTAFTALFSSFNPNTPDDTLFQPPENVYCDGFRQDRAPPEMPNYFSYSAEMIVYESSEGIAPLVSYRKVFYDYKDKISRVNFYDPLAESPDIFSPVTAQEKSVIHDYSSGTQYTIDPILGNCSQDSFQNTFSVLYAKETKGNEMLTGPQFFLLDGAKLSYNGQFSVRGMTADVYTSVQEDPQSKKRNVISWYFSTEETRIVETDDAEKNVLLRMSVRPETGDEKEGMVLINFFNFAREQPSPSKYDLRRCFNQTVSKVLVLTFPTNDLLKGSEKMIGTLTHLAIRNVTGISKQRIYINEVTFDKKYIYVEFNVLETNAPVDKSERPESISLRDALKKLKAAISKEEFSVRIQLEKSVVVLKPEPNGLNEFSGGRTPDPTLAGYKSGNVAFLAVGTCILGILVGAASLNLVMNKKFGVSLLQKPSGGGYGRELNESSM